MTLCKKQSGFTLIELVVAIAIIGILAAIAVPSYSSYLVRTKRSIAQRELAQLAGLQEARFVRARAYGTTLTQIKDRDFDGNSYFIDARGAVVADTSNERIYEIEFESDSATVFRFIATAVHTQGEKDPTCASFTLESTGAKSATGSGTNATADCWHD